MIKSKGHTPSDPAEARRRPTSLSEGGFKGAQIRKTLIWLSGRLCEIPFCQLGQTYLNSRHFVIDGSDIVLDF